MKRAILTTMIVIALGYCHNAEKDSLELEFMNRLLDCGFSLVSLDEASAKRFRP